MPEHLDATDEVNALAEAVPGAAVAVPQGVAAIALTMAMKYHDMSMIKDGQLYQQYKLEGRNIRNIELSDVFETAIQIERHLMAANERVSAWMLEALEVAITEADADDATP